MAEHRHELDRLPRVEAAFAIRLAQLIDADAAEPPSYLRALGAPPKDAKRLDAWREAAGFVEQYRIENAITHKYQPLGPEPVDDGGIVWRRETQHLDALSDRVRTPARAVDHGVER
jgi:hypothetical protein